MDLAGLLWDAAPYLTGGGLVLLIAARYGWPVHALWSSPETRRSLRQAAYIRRKWRRHAYMLNLVVFDTAPRGAERLRRRHKTAHTRAVRPRLHIRSDDWGAVIQAPTVPGIGLTEWNKAAPYLADTWQCARVAVSRPQPGAISIRAVRRDPLAQPTRYTPTDLPPATLRTVEIGLDEFAVPVPLRLSNVPGIGIYGLPGYGKTSLINGIVVRLARSPAVQFAFLDGKSDGPNGDYADLARRAFLLVGDDPAEANDALHRLVDLRQRRASLIRRRLQTRNLWASGVGPSARWPLVVVVIDEAHTYFQQTRDGGNADIRRRNATASENALLVEDLVKKGRSVGIVVILATQKGTGDAIPTAIRDVCPVSIAFACRTIDAAVAALGEDIRKYPDANPVTLQDPDYVGVATMVIQGRPGFTRARFPEVMDADAARVCQETADLTIDPAELLAPAPYPHPADQAAA